MSILSQIIHFSLLFLSMLLVTRAVITGGCFVGVSIQPEDIGTPEQQEAYRARTCAMLCDEDKECSIFTVDKTYNLGCILYGAAVETAWCVSLSSLRLPHHTPRFHANIHSFGGSCLGCLCLLRVALLISLASRYKVVTKCRPTET